MKQKKELISLKDPKSPVSEVFRTLRTNIQFMSTNKKLKTLLVTSTFPGEGKSLVTSNLAVAFAQAGKKVILIDADMRKGRQYTIFEVSPRPGLSNYLSEVNMQDQEEIDIAKYIQKTNVENLLIMSAGNVPPNPSELLVSEQMINLLEDLKAVCDIIIIDGTPCELVADSIILSRIVDSTIIVTAHKETEKDTLDKIIRNIKNVGGHLAGVVINKIPVSSKKYNEKYYYASTGAQTLEINDKKIKRKSEEYIYNQKEDKENENLYKSNLKKETNQENINDYINDEKNESLELPKFLNNKNNQDQEINNNTTIKKTNDILDKINSYLEQEKNNLN